MEKGEAATSTAKDATSELAAGETGKKVRPDAVTEGVTPSSGDWSPVAVQLQVPFGVSVPQASAPRPALATTGRPADRWHAPAGGGGEPTDRDFVIYQKEITVDCVPGSDVTSPLSVLYSRNSSERLLSRFSL